MSGRIEIRLPDGVGGEGDEPVLAGWLFEDGEAVDAGDTVAEIMIAKSTVEIDAPATGILMQAVAPETVLQPQALIGFIEVD
nr:lipoyl domain-containing protein [Sphingomonas sp. Y57]